MWPQPPVGALREVEPHGEAAREFAELAEAVEALLS